MLTKTKGLVAALAIAGAAALGACTTTDSSESGDGNANQSGSSESASSAVVGTWDLAGYDDGSQSMGAEDLADYGLTASIVVNEDGTWTLDETPGTWTANGSDAYTFTVVETTSQSGEQSGETIETVFDVTIKDGDLHLVLNDIDWIFVRAA